MKIKVIYYKTNQKFLLNILNKTRVDELTAKCVKLSGIPVDRIMLFHRGQPLINQLTSLGEFIQEYDVIEITECKVGKILENKTVECIIPHFCCRKKPEIIVSDINFKSSIKLVRQQNIALRSIFDDAYYVRELLRTNPDQLALMGQNNRRLADAMATGSIGEFAKVMMGQLLERKKKINYLQMLQRSKTSDINSQREIANEILHKNIDANLEAALEYNPELFGSVFMLYIDCKVNGHRVKAFVDSGAQTTIITVQCAKKCDIIRLVDTRWAGVAKGVGIQKIVGRVHLVELQIENNFLTTSFSVLDSQPMEMLLGLDLLRRYQVIKELTRNTATTYDEDIFPIEFTDD